MRTLEMDHHGLTTSVPGGTDRITEDASRRSAALGEITRGAREIREKRGRMLTEKGVEEALQDFRDHTARKAVEVATSTQALDRLEADIERRRADLLDPNQLLYVESPDNPRQLSNEQEVRSMLRQKKESGLNGSEEFLAILRTTNDVTTLRAAILDPSPEPYQLLTEDDKAEVLEAWSRRKWADTWADLDVQSLDATMIRGNAQAAHALIRRELGAREDPLPAGLR